MEALIRAQHEGTLHVVSQRPSALSWASPNMWLHSEKMRSTAAEEGAIERKTRARRPHAGNSGALERQKSDALS